MDGSELHLLTSAVIQSSPFVFLSLYSSDLCLRLVPTTTRSLPSLSPAVASVVKDFAVITSVSWQAELTITPYTDTVRTATVTTTNLSNGT